MPERGISQIALATSAHLSGLALTIWSITSTITVVTGQSTVNAALAATGMPTWILLVAFAGLSTLQLWGHGTQSSRVLGAADLLGGFICMTSAAAAGWVALHGHTPASAALNWATIGTFFLVHAIMLKQPR